MYIRIKIFKKKIMFSVIYNLYAPSKLFTLEILNKATRSSSQTLCKLDFSLVRGTSPLQIAVCIYIFVMIRSATGLIIHNLWVVVHFDIS